MPAGLTLRAYAKVNLHLRIGQQDRATGYHALETLFQTIGLFDTLRLTPAAGLTLAGQVGDAPAGEQNLVLRAARALQRAARTNAGARIRLTKRIPVAAGLAGGSTDAAAALQGLNLLWNTGLSHTHLKQIAKRLGADVPFLLDGGCALGTRFGDRLRPVPMPAKRWWLVLVVSSQGITTKAAYGALLARDRARAILPTNRGASEELRDLGRAWSQGDWPQPTVNSFERTAFAARPRLGRLVEGLRAAGAVAAHVSGSGPTVFGLFDTAPGARAAAGLRLNAGERLLVTRPVAQTPFVVRRIP